MDCPRVLKPRGSTHVPRSYHRGAHAPYATRWFGVTSLVGHARNLIASAIAAESIDSRDWMRPATAKELLSHCVRVLGRGPSGRNEAETDGKGTLVEALERPLWIDFVADTGDDRDVSQAVARMIFSEYVLGEGTATRQLPRGDVLLFGGDTAYPVATGEEIARRLVAPWNEVLRERTREGERRRVLLGIAGNHDWYDGLDGFGRLFRRKASGTPLGARPRANASKNRRTPKRRTVLPYMRCRHADAASHEGRAWRRGTFTSTRWAGSSR